MKRLNDFLNSITMYSLMLYYLIFLVFSAATLSFIDLLPYNFLDILSSAAYLLVICWISNKLFAKVFKVPYNTESSLITALILSLIIGPGNIQTNFFLLTFAGISAIASKYLVVWKDRNIFNPAAFGAVFTVLILHQGASWWIGSPEVLPVMLLGGFLVLKKIKRFKEVLIFLLVMLIPSFLFSASILFFASVMLIEPQTSPYKFKHQIIYAFLVALGFNIFARFIPIPLEASLLVGNIFAYIANGSFRQILKLKAKRQESADVISFLFELQKKFKFEPGQYLEWTLSHPKADNRGVRRFFTIASSSAEDFIMLSTRFAEKSSTFKTALQNMKIGDEIVVSNLAGEFVLPKDPNKKLVFIAGGIGITPFRSIIKYLIDTNQKRDIVLLYSVKNNSEIVFRNVFDAAKKIGVKTVYVTTDTMGYIDQNMIMKEVSDFKDRYFYISGPHSMIDAFEKTLKGMGIPSNQIKVDFFPGYG